MSRRQSNSSGEDGNFFRRELLDGTGLGAFSRGHFKVGITALLSGIPMGSCMGSGAAFHMLRDPDALDWNVRIMPRAMRHQYAGADYHVMALGEFVKIARSPANQLFRSGLGSELRLGK